MPPIWIEKVEAIDEDIVKINTKMKELSALHTKRLLVNFETDEQEQEQEINNKEQQIKDVFRHAEGLIKKISKQGDDDKLTQGERKVRENMQRSFGKKLQNLTGQFRITQKDYYNRLKAQKSGSDTQVFDFLSSGSSSSGGNGDKNKIQDYDEGFNEMQMAMVDDTEQLVNQRDEEITRIAKSIEELAQIFNELAVLVIDQGTILDRIDFNMESAVEHAKEGVEQLVKAEENQKNALPLRCIILLVFLIFIMIVILIVKHTDNSKK